VTTIVSQPMEGIKRFDKKHDEHVNPPFTIIDNRLESLEFISTNVPLTPHLIGIGQKVTLISNTMHPLEVFTTPITTFEDTHDQQKIAVLICRTPTLAKCGGEAQHLEKSGVGVLRDSRMFRARQQGAKHLALGCS
jgi:hypothetical protein